MPKSTKTTQSSTTKPRTRKSATTSATSIVETTPSTAVTSVTATLNHDEIAHRAYELFLSNGASHGRDIEHWLQAESELRNRSVSARN